MPFFWGIANDFGIFASEASRWGGATGRLTLAARRVDPAAIPNSTLVSGSFCKETQNLDSFRADSIPSVSHFSAAEFFAFLFFVIRGSPPPDFSAFHFSTLHHFVVYRM
jgi:hypothetical protein